MSIIDGDTLELKPVSNADGEPTGEPNITVRILSFNALGPDACGGPEAAAELEWVIDTSGFFRVTYDASAARMDSDDLVRGPLSSGDGSGTPMDLGSTMIYNGFADAWYESGEAEPERYAKYAEMASTNKELGTGIWADCESIKN